MALLCESKPASFFDATTYHVDINILLMDPAKALLPVLQSVEGWHKIKLNDFEVARLSGAMTNLVYKCSRQTGQDCLLVRVSGSSDGVVDPKAELATFLAVTSAGLGPELRGLFQNGRVEEFLLQHITLTPRLMMQPLVSACIARALAKFHMALTPAMLSQRVDGSSANTDIWSRLHAWLHLAESLLPKDGPDVRDLSTIAAEVSELEIRATSHYPAWHCFGHHDLQYGNVMMLGRSVPRVAGGSDEEDGCAWPDIADGVGLEEDAEGGGVAKFGSFGRSASLSLAPADLGVTLIDYDYCAFGPATMDISNHWCEWAANYHTDQPHLLDYSRYPSRGEQLTFVRAYLESLLAHVGVQVLESDGAMTPSSASYSSEGTLEASLGDEDLSNHIGEASNGVTSASGMAKESSMMLQPGAMSQDVSGMVGGERQGESVNKSKSTTEGDDTNSTEHAVSTVGPSGQVAAAQLGRKPAVSTRVVDYGAVSSQIQGNHASQGSSLPHASKGFSSVQDWLDHLGLGPVGGGLPVSSVTERQLCNAVKMVVRDCNAVVCLSHLQWALWGWIQARSSSVDFDFTSYADQRWAMYHKTKGQLLGQ